MFFRRKPKTPPPINGEDGYYYAEEGQAYDSDEFETDSDYSCISEEDHKSDHEMDTAVHVLDDKIVDGKEQQDESESKENPIPVPVPVPIVEAEVNGGNYVIVAKDTVEEMKTIDSDAAELQESKVTVQNAEEGNEIPILDGDEENTELLELESDSKESLIDTHPSMNSAGSSGVDVTVDLEEDNAQPPPEKVTNNETMNTSKTLPSTAKEPQQSTSLHEKRSLLALAAERDRVDIIKKILQPNPNSDNIALAQLLLNNMIAGGGSHIYTKDDLEPTFLPPLHIAIASSSTNAASCLLRMGSNPAIRPKIPNEWKGPDWKDEKGKIVADGEKWYIFHNMTAWELAFGTTTINPDGLAGKKGWFGFKSSSKSNDDVPKLYIPIKIETAKLEGIKHAFTAEALRAIGSDEVARLVELLDSGLGSTARIEIGGKDLFGWCHEMNAAKCIQMLEARYLVPSSDPDNIEDDQVADTPEDKNENVIDIPERQEILHVYDESILRALQNKVEESESLATALSSMLDNLAEEVSVTQGLLMQPGSDSNAALLSQVRLFKKQRTDVEDEISHCEACLSDRYAEHDMCTMWWLKRGGSLNDIPIRVPPAVKVAQAVPTVKTLKILVKEAAKQLTLSENKVRKLRASIADLSQESSRNLEVVEKLGLLGAVNLTRKLKDEVRVQKVALEAVVREESSVRARVAMLREMLEREQIPRNQAQSKTAQSSDVAIDRVVPSQNLDTIIEVVRPESPIAGVAMLRGMLEREQISRNQAQSKTAQSSNVAIDRVMSSQNLDTIIEVVRPESPIVQEMTSPDQSYDDSDASYDSIDDESYYSGESESDSDSYDSDEESDEMPHSKFIKMGHSAAIVKWVDDGDLGVFTFKIWNLLQRMFGLSRKAITQTAKATVDEVINIPRVLII